MGRALLSCCLGCMLVSGIAMGVAAGGAATGAVAKGADAAKESPFACAMNAFTPAERKQHFEEFGPKLRGYCKGIRELPNGYEFRFAPDPAAYQVLSAWMLQERLCCPFFDLNLRLDREGGPMWLTLTGRDGVKEFIAEEFHPWFEKVSEKQG